MFLWSPYSFCTLKLRQNGPTNFMFSFNASMNLLSGPPPGLLSTSCRLALSGFIFSLSQREEHLSLCYLQVHCLDRTTLFSTPFHLFLLVLSCPTHRHASVISSIFKRSFSPRPNQHFFFHLLTSSLPSQCFSRT